MNYQQNLNLAEYTTFHIGGPARFFTESSQIAEFLEAKKFAKKNKLPILVFSGGSNMLIADEGFPGLVLKVNTYGFDIVLDNSEECVVKLGAAEIWDEVVARCVEKSLWGIENLSHIPGRVGGVPVQNVGAYGQEASDVIVSVDALDLETDELVTIPSKECAFTYRHSIFNTTAKGRYIILYVRIRLGKLRQPNLKYSDLQKKFGDNIPTLMEIRKAVIEIRDKKFPFPDSAKKGNAGSCFKNPILSEDEYNNFLQTAKEILLEEHLKKLNEFKQKQSLESGVKVPAALLLDVCGLKGLEFGGARINPNQPLVIVNFTGQASSYDVLNIIRIVRQTVYEKTGIALKIEPELVGFPQEKLEEYLKLI